MHGIVFNLLEHVVTEGHGEAAWDDLLARTGADGCWTAVGNYPDADLVRLLEALPGSSERGLDETLRAFGYVAMDRLAQLYPHFFAPHASTTPFLLTLNNIIHPAVRCLYPGAEIPAFDVDLDDDDDSRLVLRYRSSRRLCHLAEGFLTGAAAHYGERVELTQTQCMHDGAPACLLSVTFTRAATHPVPTQHPTPQEPALPQSAPGPACPAGDLRAGA